MFRSNAFFGRLGRVFLGVMFLAFGFDKVRDIPATIGLMRDHAVPLPEVVAYVVMAIEILGGLLLVLGIGERVAAALLAAYLVPVTLIAHPFWSAGGPEMMMQRIEFLKNLGLTGGLLAIAAEVPVALIHREPIRTEIRPGDEIPV